MIYYLNTFNSNIINGGSAGSTGSVGNTGSKGVGVDVADSQNLALDNNQVQSLVHLNQDLEQNQRQSQVHLYLDLQNHAHALDQSSHMLDYKDYN